MSQLYRTLTGQSQKSHHSETLAPTQTNTTTDPLSGVLNHLTEPQGNKLDEFKQRLQKGGWWSPEGINGKPTHDDGTLLRYLRARKFDVAGAIGQFTDTEKWLKEQKVDELYENFDVDIYERARLMYPQWTGHRDRRGIPIYVYVVKGLDSKNVAKYQKESQKYKDSLSYHKKLATPAKMIPLFALYHNLLNFVLPMVSSLERPNPEVPVTNSTNIVDISSVGLTQFWNLKGHMQDASVLATAHYPETLDRIFIIGAPSFFPTVWGWVKRWFDPVTVSKIFILSKAEVKPTLEKFMDPKDIPKLYGGHLDWEWGQLPDIDEETSAALSRDGNNGWVAGPCLWLDQQRVIVGSENGKLRRSPKEIEKMKPIVYAADYTEVPVHPDRKAIGGAANGQLRAPKGPPLERKPSAYAVKAAQIATGTAVAGGAAAAAATASSSRPTSKQETKSVEQPKQATQTTSATQNADIKQENLRTAPMDGAQVHLPPNQPAYPGQTAEYISEKEPQTATGVSGAADVPEIKEPGPEPQTNPSKPATEAPVNAIAATTGGATSTPNGKATQPAPVISQSSLISSSTHTPPPGVTQPGPLSKHQVEVTKAIAAKLEVESQSFLPESANGAIPHPEVIVASDKSKGLALEKEKIDALAPNGTAEGRPEMQRFITAAEF